MVDYLQELGVGILFAIGGDGTLRGAQAIGEEAARRGLKLGVIGVPEDDRQRRLVRAEDVRLRDGGHRGAAARPMRPTPRRRRRATASGS